MTSTKETHQIWTSKQRINKISSGKLQSAVTLKVDDVREEFIDWLYGSPKVKRGAAPPLSDMLQFCKNNYYPPHDKRYDQTRVLRRTLSPDPIWGATYVSEAKHLVLAENLKRRTENKARGYLGPVGIKYSEVGHNIGCLPYVESDPNDIIVKHLADGFSKTAAQVIDELKAKTTVVRTLENNNYNLKVFRRKMRLEKHKWAKLRRRPRQQNLHEANSMLLESSRQMYEILHETEHRLLAVQAGVPYLNHVEACKNRRTTEQYLKNKSRHTHLQMKPTSPDEPEIQAEERIMEDKIKLTTYNHKAKETKDGTRRNFDLTYDVALTSGQNRQIARKKQQFYDKLTYIYIVMCTIHNMKKIHYEQETALPWETLKKLRVDPYADERLFIKAKKTCVAESLPPLNLHPTNGHNYCHKPTNPLHRPTQTLSDKTLCKATSKDSKLVMERSSNKQFIHKHLSSVSQFTNTVPSKIDVNKVSSRHASHYSKLKPNGCLSPGRHAVLNTQDPVITWDEFLKLGTKTGDKPKHMRFATDFECSDQKKPVVQTSVSEDFSKTSLCFAASTVQIRRSISKMWHLMRKSFLKIVESDTELSLDHTEDNHTLLLQLGLDQSNPVSHFKLNWFKFMLQSNNTLMKTLEKHNREAKICYATVQKSEEITDTIKWKHKWHSTYNFKRRQDVADQGDEIFIDCIEALKAEARSLELIDNPLVNHLLNKIRRIYLEDEIKYLTIYRGQPKVLMIVLSTPAYEICTRQMQTALQYVLVNVLNGETSLLKAMMKQRGLPLHPEISEQKKTESIESLKRNIHKTKIVDYVKMNRTLSTKPPVRDRLRAANAVKTLSKNPNHTNFCTHVPWDGKSDGKSIFNHMHVPIRCKVDL